MRVDNKVILVTGSSRGIGLSIAQTLAAHGGNVVICSTKQEKATEVAAQISKEYGVKTLGVAANISDESSVQALISSVMDHFGRIDVLVNNAGITRDNLLLRLKKDEWQDVIDTNLNSVFYSSKAVLKPMIKQKGGRIINIASVVGVIGNPGQSNYAAAKAGMIGFTKSIAKEYASRGVISNVVAPGFIETDMIEALPDDYINNIIKEIPLGRLGRPEEIAKLVLFLSSDYANYMTGKVFTIDGGLSM